MLLLDITLAIVPPPQFTFDPDNSPNITYEKYGAWRSPFSAEVVTGDTNFLHATYEPTSDLSFWLEGRPDQSGRFVLVQVDNFGNKMDLIPEDFNSRSSVYEYGGSPVVFLTKPRSANDPLFKIIFSNFKDQNLYIHYPHVPNFRPFMVTNFKNETLRFVDGIHDEKRNRIIYVAERHISSKVVNNFLMSIDLKTYELKTLVEGCDFYAFPRMNKDRTKIAYVSWNFPNMPWDDTNLFIADFNEAGDIINRKLINGKGESVIDPKWGIADPEALFFISDRTEGYWTVHRYKDEKIEVVIPPNKIHYKEIGEPIWQFGTRYFDLLPNDNIMAIADKYVIEAKVDSNDLSKTTIEMIENRYSYSRTITSSKDGSNILSLIGGSSTEIMGIVRVTIPKDANDTSDYIFKQQVGTNLPIDERFISRAVPISFNTSNGDVAYGYFLPPTNPFYQPADPNDLPPLLVKSHGGPTDKFAPVLDLRAQFWTSRGIGVLLVNYRGSSGYGRRYRKLLNSNWGIYDVDDCCNAALHLVKQGKASGEKLLITGSSAGGYTTLAALTFRNVFKGGSSYYGIGNLEALFAETHKYESHYQDYLLGPYEFARDIYYKRSPVNYVEELNSSIAMFHGALDEVVPPAQSREMYEHLLSKGLPTMLEIYPGEGHGFLNNRYIVRSLEGEYYFYSRILSFEAKDISNKFNITNDPSTTSPKKHRQQQS
eukprot:gene5301-6146_t